MFNLLLKQICKLKFKKPVPLLYFIWYSEDTKHLNNSIHLNI